MSDVDLAKLEALARTGDQDALYRLHREWMRLDMPVIHLTEVCPTCGGPALLMERCRCAWYCIKCPEGHDWHTCYVHKTQVPGSPHNRDLRLEKCTCPQEATA